MKDKLKNNNFITFLILFGLASLLFSCGSGQEEKKDSTILHDDVYYCPMDTDVVQNGKGKCPKCKMDLIPKTNNANTYYCPMCPEQEQQVPGECKKCKMDLVKKTEHKNDSETYYTCPMHPQIKEKEPGSCPICGMTLVKKEDHKEQEVSNDKNFEIIANPTNSNILSSVKIITPVRKKIPITLKVLGYIAYDPQRVYDISARFAGRIEKLYVKSEYQQVKKGQALLDIFSHELYATQHEYSYLKKTDPNSEDIIKAAKKKLLLLGMSEEQIQNLNHTVHSQPTTTIYSPVAGYVIEKLSAENKAEDKMGQKTESIKLKAKSGKLEEQLWLREGAYVERGENLFKIVNTDIVWGIFELFSEQLQVIKKGQALQIKTDEASEIINGSVDFIEPSYKKNSQTSQIRVYLNNRNKNLKIGNILSAEIKAGNKNALWIPGNAVLDLGFDKIVFVKKDNTFETRKIATGIVSGDLTEILNGLSPQDQVAENAQFMVDSESFIKVSSNK